MEITSYKGLVPASGRRASRIGQLLGPLSLALVLAAFNIGCVGVTASKSTNTATGALQINTPALPNAITQTAYSGALSATGGTTPYTWGITSGSLPPGLNLNSSSGAITGTPTTAGTFTFTAQAKDSSPAPQTATASASVLTVELLQITTTSLPDPQVQTSYSATLTASGGMLPYIWSISSGSLPPGLGLDSSSGAISGVPTSTGSYAFTVEVSDPPSVPQKSQKYLHATVQPKTLQITTSSLPSGQVQTADSAALVASGGTTPYSWSISSGGSLPAGLALNLSTGAISGTPTQSGTFSFTAQVTDSGSKTAQQALSIQVAAVGQLSITTTSLPQGTTGAAYSATLQANNGTTPYSWTISSSSLPAGLSLNASTGAISGTPTQSGTFSFTAQVADSANNKAQQLLSMQVLTTLSITTTPQQGTVGVAYSATLQATGGTTPYSWTISSGPLPTGLSLNSVTGAISGTPTQSGTFSFTAQVMDSANNTGQKLLSMVISAALSITTTSLPPGSIGIAYAVTLQAIGGSPSYTWSISGSLPAGLSLLASTGQISGIPTTVGTSNFTAQANDSSNPPQTAKQSLTLATSAPSF